MKIMKKIATLILSVCLVVPCFGLLAYAANGTIMFTDPSATAGEVLEVTGVVRAGAAIGDADLNLTYDSAFLKFKSGDNVTETAAGQLTYSGKGTGTEKELRFNMQFDVLKEGTTKIEVAGYKAYLFSDEKLTCQQGSSTITIAPGAAAPAPEAPPQTAAEGVSVTVGDKQYTLSDGFAATDIPAGFVETTMEYDGAQRRFVKQETAETYLGYLTDAEGKGKFFLYNVDNATFAPFELISISENTSIVLLAERGNVKLPKEYQETSIMVNDQDFPAWRSVEKGDYYILYAVNAHGEKSLYQYDSVDGTYQRFEAPKVQEEKKDDSFLAKLTAPLKKYMEYIVLGGIILFVVFVVLLIVLAVKLRNRNIELDDLYDEYGLDLEDEEEEPEPVKAAEKKSLFKKAAQKPAVESDDDFDFSEDTFMADDFTDSDFADDDYEDDEFEDDDFEDDDFTDDDFADDDYEEEAVQEAYTEVPPVVAHKPKKEEFEDFDLDFIDLDD